MVNAQGTKLSHDKEVLENNGDDDGAELDITKASDAEANKEAVGKDGKVDDDDKVMDDGSSDDGDATDEVPWSDVIETKYYYAGGSARFMFDYPLSELRSQLEKHCASVKDWQYFAQGAITSGTPSTVNTLMQQFDEKASPLSKYILFRAYEICKTSLVRAVKAVATSSNNPALNSWAFELEQIDFIRLSLESPSENREYITNSNGLSFNPHSAIAFDEKKFEHDGAITENGIVIWCLKWNQGLL